MIMTRAADILAEHCDEPAQGWRSLARRGMLSTEVQVFDIAALPAGGQGLVLEPGCVEVLYCLRGTVEVREGKGPPRVLGSGEMLAVRLDWHDRLAAVYATASAVVLRLRVLPLALLAGLPKRWPTRREGGPDAVSVTAQQSDARRPP